MIHIWGYRPGIISLILGVTILSSKCLILRRMEFKLNWAYSWLWFHTIQRKSLSYFKQNLCWIIYITQIMSHEISQVWILFGGFVVLGWRCHYSTPPGRAAARARAQPFSQGSTHHDQLIKAPRVAPAHTSLWTLWYWATYKHICNDHSWSGFLTA